MANSSQSSIYKYCSIKTANQILSSQAIRWSASHLFQDPMEFHAGSKLNFDKPEFLSTAIKISTGYIFSKEMPRGNSSLITAIRRWREDERFDSPEEAEGVLKDLLLQMVQPHYEVLDKILRDWKIYTQCLRIACFAKTPDNLSNWQQFGSNHRGITLRFDYDNSPSLSKPIPIRYQTNRPSIVDIKDELGVALFQEQHKAQDHFQEKFTTKSDAFSQQQEVRCFYQQDVKNEPIDSNPSNWFIDRPFGSEDLKGVYFGLKTKPEDKKAIYKLVNEKYRGVKFYNVKLTQGKYEMEIERIAEKSS